MSLSYSGILDQIFVAKNMFIKEHRQDPELIIISYALLRQLKLDNFVETSIPIPDMLYGVEVRGSFALNEDEFHIY